MKNGAYMEDRELVALFWARSQDAVPETARKYGTFCLSVARNFLDSPEDAEKCVNDVWYEAWTSIPTQKPDNLRTWLGRAVRCSAIDRFRKNSAEKRSRAVTVMLEELEESVPSADSVEKVAESHEIACSIEQWLRTLDREDRILFVRRYWYGDSLGVLAEKYGESESRLAQKMFRLRKSLKAALEKEGIEV